MPDEDETIGAVEDRRMGAVIGDLLPLAVGVAISPVPIIAEILMLMSVRPGRTSVGFLVGWVVGIVLVTTVLLVVVGTVGGPPRGPSPVSSVLKLVFGVLLLLIAVRQWRSRPREGAEAGMPKWMGRVDSFTAAKASGLGFVLSAVNPKNLVLCLGAGTTIGAAQMSAGSDVVGVAVFTVIAASTVAGPVIAYLAARDRMEAPLEKLRGWLTQNNAVVMAVLMLVLGTVLVGKGIGGLTG